jgi:hypothetical protein
MFYLKAFGTSPKGAGKTLVFSGKLKTSIFKLTACTKLKIQAHKGPTNINKSNKIILFDSDTKH